MSQNGLRADEDYRIETHDQLSADPSEIRGMPENRYRSGEPDGRGADELLVLCKEATDLVGRLPGRLRRVVLRGTGHSVEIEWHGDGQAAVASAAPVLPGDAYPAVRTSMHEADRGPGPGSVQGAGAAAGSAPPSASGAGVEADTLPAGAYMVVAPLVGTFYRAPEPGAPAFVEVGDLVEPGQTVGIVEAMKLMNPVVAETAGRVAAIHVENGQFVEFGQNLVCICPT